MKTQKVNDLIDTDLKINTIQKLRTANLFTTDDVQNLRRNEFLSQLGLSYPAKLDVLNYLHLNHLYFIDDL